LETAKLYAAPTAKLSVVPISAMRRVAVALGCIVNGAVTPEPVKVPEVTVSRLVPEIMNDPLAASTVTLRMVGALPPVVEPPEPGPHTPDI
jgi:hypothetical protein